MKTSGDMEPSIWIVECLETTSRVKEATGEGMLVNTLKHGRYIHVHGNTLIYVQKKQSSKHSYKILFLGHFSLKLNVKEAKWSRN